MRIYIARRTVSFSFGGEGDSYLITTNKKEIHGDSFSRQRGSFRLLFCVRDFERATGIKMKTGGVKVLRLHVEDLP